MKKTVLVIIICAVIFSLCACGAYKGPKGIYTDAESGSSISFNGKQATFTDSKETVTYDYVMDGETIVLTLNNGRLVKSFSYSEEEDTVYLNIEDSSRVTFAKAGE
jgi:predicted small lipoprotein YifL